MGLLDAINGLGNLSDDQSMGLLAAGTNMIGNSFSTRAPSNVMQLIGEGAGVYKGTQAALRKQREDEEAARQMIAMRGLQMQGLQGEQDDKAIARQHANDLRNFYTDQRTGTPAPYDQTVKTMGGDMRPTVANAARMDGLTASAPAAAAQDNPYAERMTLADALRAKGFHAEADAMEEKALKFQPKVKNWNEVQVDGKVMYAPYFEDGRHGAPVPLEVARKLEFRNLNDRDAGVDPYTGKEMTSYKKGQSPDSIASNALGWARLSQDKAALDTPQYMDTSEGVVALPKKLAPGQLPTATPVMGANGQPVEKKQNVPQYVVEGVSGNAKALASIDAAIASLKTKEGKDAVGYKGYLPNGLLNRMDPEGVTTRANISDVGSLVLHDRSGAAVTAAESPRLMPFIPLSTDDNETALKKLTRMRQLTQAETDNLTFAYPSAKKLANFAAENAPTPGKPAPEVKTVSLSDIAATAKASGKSTAQVTADLKAKGYTIGGM